MYSYSQINICCKIRRKTLYDAEGRNDNVNLRHFVPFFLGKALSRSFGGSPGPITDSHHLIIWRDKLKGTQVFKVSLHSNIPSFSLLVKQVTRIMLSQVKELGVKLCFMAF